ncbi:AbiTii domain-containing protein [Nocardiopsis terrae]|uniref:AbiTii domain-containing protein n=1 Tax=Streptomyces sp. NPDC057554 TaxID=3350538 RepID=UPI00368C8FD5
MSMLEQIIQDASTSSVPVADVLRKMLVVSYRIQSQETIRWVNHELNGYPSDTTVQLPTYRGPFALPAQGTYSGPYGSSRNGLLDAHGVPKEFIPAMFECRLSEPIMELEALAAGEDDPGLLWSPTLISQWNTWEDEGRVPGIQLMNLISARTVIPRSKIQGVIDSIRNNALTFALELQSSYPQAGETDGPTIQDTGVQRAVSFMITNVFGSGNNVSLGDGNTLNMTVQPGDLEGLLDAAAELGLDDHARDELAEAVTGEGSPEEKRSRLAAFGQRVKQGSVSLTGNITANLAATKLLELGTQFLGG